MAPPMGVNYLDKNYSKYVQKPMESLLDFPHASVIARVYENWAVGGTKYWGKKTVEWFLIYLMTEIACTPHAIQSGYAAPDIALAYHSIVQDLVWHIITLTGDTVLRREFANDLVGISRNERRTISGSDTMRLG